MPVSAFSSSILFISFLAITAFIAVMFLRVQQRSDRRQKLAGAAANGMALLGFLGYALMSSPPDPWATRLTNLCIALATVLCAYATLLAVKRRAHIPLYVLWLLVLQALTTWYTLVDDQIMVRSAIASVMMALLFGWTAAEVLVAYARDRNRDYFFFVAVFATGAGVLLHRLALSMAAIGLDAPDVREYTMSLALVTLFVLLVVWNFAMYVLLIGDYQRQLQAANAELEGRVAARTHDLQVTADELRVTAGELRHANAGKDAFMAAVSHELRTPLTGILSMSEVLQLGVHGPLSAGQARSVGVIAASGKRLLATVNRVLLYTQLVGGRTPIQQEPCPLADLCAVAVRAVQAEANRKQQQLAQSVEPRDLEIESDPEGICNILTMLLDNAVKFTPEGGQVCVHICAAGDAGSSAGAGSVQIVVADTGIGMSAEELERLFLPFTQADMTLARRFEGVGVGLAYVQAMVDRLGGAIAVASTPQVGTRFTITLPAVMPAAAPV